MFQIILEALNLKASSKTQKYFLKSTYFNEYYPSFINTVIAIVIASQDSGNVNVEDEIFKVNDYIVPTFVVNLAKRYRIFLNEKGYYFGKPILSGNLEVDQNVGIMTPFEFEKFIKGYNENQDELIACSSSITVRKVLFLYEVSHVVLNGYTYSVGSSTDAKLEEDEFYSLLLNYDFHLDVTAFCHKQLANSERRLVEWACSNIL